MTNKISDDTIKYRLFYYIKSDMLCKVIYTLFYVGEKKNTKNRGRIATLSPMIAKLSSISLHTKKPIPLKNLLQ